MARRRRAETTTGLVRSCLSIAVGAIGGAVGCFPPDEGVEPDPQAIYFPTGLTLSPVERPRACPQDSSGEVKHKWLYVANSDFDLQFNAGTVQVLDLDLVDQVVDAMNLGAEKPEDRCPEVKLFNNAFGGKKSEADQFVAPGLCNPAPTAAFIKASVKIGAFATDVRYLQRPDGTTGSDMLVIPIRGDRTLHWIDTDRNDPARLLECGADADGRCDTNHRRGDNAQEDNTRSAELPREPFGIAADDRGEAIVTTHQSDGALALFVNDWTKQAEGQKGPTLQFVLRDSNNIPLGAVGIVSIPEPDFALALRGTEASTFYEPGYYATYRNSAQVSLVRYFSDQGEFESPEIMGTYPGRAFLELGGAVPIVTNSQGFDSRGVAVDSSKRRACECSCDPGPDDCRSLCVEGTASVGATPDEMKAAKTAACDPDTGQCASYVQCLRSCARTPLGVFVSNRTPSSLIVGRTSPNSSATAGDDLPTFYDTEQLQPGPSRVVIGSVRVPDGKGGTRPSGRVFVICFDSRQIFVYDPEAPARIEGIIRTGRGPHSFVVDEARGLGYIGHFTDSYVGVVDLDQAHPNTYGKIVLSIGPVVPPRAQK